MPDCLFKVRTRKKIGDLPEGSFIEVEKERGKYYIGKHTHEGITYRAQVLKENCDLPKNY